MRQDLLGLFNGLHPSTLHFISFGKHLDLQGPTIVDLEPKLALTTNRETEQWRREERIICLPWCVADAAWAPPSAGPLHTLSSPRSAVQIRHVACDTPT